MGDLRTMIRSYGTTSQVARFEVGRLPEAELLAIARDAVFETLNGFARYERVGIQHIRHKYHCGAQPHHLSCEVTSPYKGPLGPGAWTRLRAIEDALNQIREVSGLPVTWWERRHLCTCGVCGATRAAMSILVHIEWCGHTLAREYDLPSHGASSAP